MPMQNQQNVVHTIQQEVEQLGEVPRPMQQQNAFQQKVEQLSEVPVPMQQQTGDEQSLSRETLVKTLILGGCTPEQIREAFFFELSDQQLGIA